MNDNADDSPVERDVGCSCPMWLENHCIECGTCIESNDPDARLCYLCWRREADDPDDDMK